MSDEVKSIQPKKKLSIPEQVAIIQRVLNDPTYFDDEQKIEAGLLKRKPAKKEYFGVDDE